MILWLKMRLPALEKLNNEEKEKLGAGSVLLRGGRKSQLEDLGAGILRRQGLVM